MGTAGHVDHGKTALIKALTGYDCDTHSQEKQRGITINLGFSHFDLPSGNSVGIVDVPGHSDFIKTMVAGACGLDFVLLIIAADEGIMPQTIEHLEIMKILGIKNGIIVQTKSDIVDDELLKLSEEEIEEFVEGSFLENAPIIPVSSITKNGIPKLINTISDLINNISEKDSNGIFRMYVDRIFTKEGFGTIVNGSVISGKVSKDENVYLLPKEKTLRIRKMEHHGKETEKIVAGDRASFNLVGLKQKDIQKGMMLTNKKIKSTKLIDVELQLFHDISIKLWSQVILLLGTNRLMCRMHLLDKNFLQAGESCLAQIYLSKEIITFIDDRFVIRNSSGNLTIGGGKIVDPYPLHHRRRREKQIKNVQILASGKLENLIIAEVKKQIIPISYKSIAEDLNLEPNELIDVIFQDLSDEMKFFQTDEDVILLTKKKYTFFQNKILTGLQNFHTKNSLLKKGKTLKELMGIFGENQTDTTRKTLSFILEKLEENNKLEKVENTWKLASHNIKIDNNLQIKLDKIEKFINNSQNQVIDFKEIQETEIEQNQEKLEQILAYLLEQNTIYFLQQKYIHIDLIKKGKKLLIDRFSKSDVGLRLSEFRDMLNTNRMTAMIILEYFDSRGITLRKKDFRFLTNKFKNNL